MLIPKKMIASRLPNTILLDNAYLSQIGVEFDTVEPIDQWNRLKLVKIISAARIARSQKGLLKLVVFDGQQNHTVICGDTTCKPKEIVIWAEPGIILSNFANKQILIDRKCICDEWSSGMICSLFDIGISNSHQYVIRTPYKHLLGSSLRDLLGNIFFNLECTPNISRCLSAVGLVEEITLICNTKSTLKHQPRSIMWDLLKPRWTKKWVSDIWKVKTNTNFRTPYASITCHSLAYIECPIIRICAKQCGIDASLDMHLIISHLVYLETGIYPIFNTLNNTITLHTAWHNSSHDTHSTKTEAKHFAKSLEHGVSINALYTAIDAIHIYVRKPNISNIEIHLPINHTKEISLPKKHFAVLQGISSKEIRNCLLKISSGKLQYKEDYYSIQIPLYRTEWESYADITNVISKMQGLKRFTQLPPISVPISKKLSSASFYITKQITHFLLASGYNEAFSTSIINKTLQHRIEKSILQDQINQIVYIENVDGYFLRPSLLSGLLESVFYHNSKLHSTTSIHSTRLDFFEIGTVFRKLSENNIVEKTVVGILSCDKDIHTAFHKAQTIVSQLTSLWMPNISVNKIRLSEQSNIENIKFIPIENHFYKQHTVLWVHNQEVILTFGLVSLPYNVSGEKVFYIEIDLARLNYITEQNIHRKMIPSIQEIGPLCTYKTQLADEAVLLHAKYEDCSIKCQPDQLRTLYAHLCKHIDAWTNTSTDIRVVFIKPPYLIDLFHQPTSPDIISYTFRIEYKIIGRKTQKNIIQDLILQISQYVNICTTHNYLNNKMSI